MTNQNNQVIYSSRAAEDLNFWVANSPKTVDRINKLIQSIKLSPYHGIGKPEPLKFDKSGYWSRRISQEHRLVYKLANGKIYIAQCRYHY